MTGRGRTLTLLGGAIVLLLLLGRRGSLILSDYWWGSTISSDAASFLLQFQLLRLVLDGAAVLVASTWFIGNLFMVYRALGLVQVPRYVANLEFREAVTSNLLLGIAVALGAVLGLLAGLGAADWWANLALAWYGVEYGVTEPLLGNDLGVYVAQLPWWRTLRSFALLLVVTGMAVVVLLYAAIGSIRWMDNRPAISNHARAHLGFLLATLALCIAWSGVLLPYEVVAGLHGPESAGAWAFRKTSSSVLAGTAFATAVLSALWALRPRHSLVLASWIVLSGTWLGVRVALPGMADDQRESVPEDVRRSMERLAFGLESLVLEPVSHSAPVPPGDPVTSPWSVPAIRQLVEVDSASLIAAVPVSLTFGGARRAVWLTVSRSEGAVTGSAVVADRTTAAGDAMSYLPADSVAYPSVQQLVSLDSATGGYWPGAARHRLSSGGDGYPVGSWLRRAVLAWGLQLPRLLGGVPRDGRLAWHRDPMARVAHLAPFAHWTSPQPAWDSENLYWLVSGFIMGETFPGVTGQSWSGRFVRQLRPGFLAVIEASTGETSLYLLPETDDVATTWADVAGGMVKPSSAIPPTLLSQLRYSEEFAAVQSRALSGGLWGGGVPIRDLGDGSSRTGGVDVGWLASGRPGFTVAYQERGTRRLGGLFRGYLLDGVPFLHLASLDSALGSPTPAILHQRWSRFPLFEQIRDSIRQEGARVESGPVQYQLSGGGLIAQSPAYAIRDGARARVAWYSLAAGNRLGAGRSPMEAWSNLAGNGVPRPPGQGPESTMAEARRWMRLADSALAVGDWETFGRAFGALRDLLRHGGD